MRHHLVPHPAAAATPFTAVGADIRASGPIIHVVFRVAGASALLLPQGAGVRRDGLWRTTCFEVFVRPGAGEDYLEFNFAPSGDWAAYVFDGYRRGMANAAVGAPLISWSRFGRVAELAARIPRPDRALGPSARIGLTAVLETRQGAKSFWALAHPGDKPDFHDARAFIARISPGSSP